VPPSILLPLWGDLEDVPVLDERLMIEQVRRPYYVPQLQVVELTPIAEPGSDIGIYKRLSSEERNGRAVGRDGPRAGENPVAMLATSALSALYYRSFSPCTRLPRSSRSPSHEIITSFFTKRARGSGVDPCYGQNGRRRERRAESVAEEAFETEGAKWRTQRIGMKRHQCHMQRGEMYLSNRVFLPRWEVSTGEWSTGQPCNDSQCAAGLLNRQNDWRI
jgi:hypothetical protein